MNMHKNELKDLNKYFEESKEISEYRKRLKYFNKLQNIKLL